MDLARGHRVQVTAATGTGEAVVSAAEVTRILQNKGTGVTVEFDQGHVRVTNAKLQADQQKLQSSGGVMSDNARAELEKKIERQQVDIQRATQDAQQEVQELQQQLQNEFQTKLMPIVYYVRKPTTRCIDSTQVSKANTNDVISFEFSPDGRQLASGSAERTVGLRDPKTTKFENQFTPIIVKKKSVLPVFNHIRILS